MISLRETYEISLIFWDRDLDVSAQYSVPDGVESRKIKVKAPLGDWVRRAIPLWHFLREAIQQLRSLEPAVVHCANPDMLLVTAFYKTFYKRGVKIVYEIADLPKLGYNSNRRPIKALIKRLFNWSERYLCTKVSLLIVTSPYFWDMYYRRFIPKSKVLWIPNTPERRHFQGFQTRRSLTDGSLVVGFIGQIRYPKQIRLLIDASEGLPGVSVFLAGEGPSYQAIMDYCRNRSHVYFHGPYNYDSEICELYSRVDCVYSVYDTSVDNVLVALPNRLYEAIVCALPVIVADGTALSKFVVDEGFGYSVPADDVSCLRAVLQEIQRDSIGVARIRSKMIAVREDYFAEEGFDKLRRSYEKVLLDH